MSKQEFDRILGHGADNDGIDEYDNPLPRWWVAMFGICVVWGIGYAVDWHFVSHRSQAAMYDAEVAAAAAKWPVKEVAIDAAAITADAVSTGEEIYKTNCAACHGAELQGGIGPNLVDDEWIHGGELADIAKTISEGVPDKGMVTWGPVLGPEKVNQVAAYVYSKAQK